MADSVKATWQNNMTFTSTSKEGEIRLDASKDVGGDDNGLRSKSLMLSSLAGCTGMDLASLIKKMRVEINGMSIEVVAELTDEHPKTYKNTHVTYNFDAPNADPAKLKKIVELSFNKYCGVIAMFKSFSVVTYEINH